MHDLAGARRQGVERLLELDPLGGDAELADESVRIAVGQVRERRVVANAGHGLRAALEPHAAEIGRAVRRQGQAERAAKLGEHVGGGRPGAGVGVGEHARRLVGPSLPGVRFDQQEGKAGGEQGIGQFARAGERAGQQGGGLVRAALADQEPGASDGGPEAVVPRSFR